MVSMEDFHSSHDACRDADRIAAGNWHALANFVGKSFCSDGLLIDIGSTTTDIIPILQGAVATTARTDYRAAGGRFAGLYRWSANPGIKPG